MPGISNFVTGDELDQTLNNYVTENELNVAIDNVEVDLTGYATITYVNNEINGLRADEECAECCEACNLLNRLDQYCCTS